MLQISRRSFWHLTNLLLTKFLNSFQNSSVVETDLSDVHRMIVTVMKTSFLSLQPKTRHYRDYRNYDNNIFRISLFNELSKLHIEAMELNKFITVCINTLNNHAPSKKKYIRTIIYHSRIKKFQTK